MKLTDQRPGMLTIPVTERNCAAFRAYQDQRRSAKNRRKVPFELTFTEWMWLWLSSGYWDQRGNKRDDYVMARIGDQGPYAVGNVFFQTVAENAREGNLNSGRKYRHVRCTSCGISFPANVMWRHKRKCPGA